MVDEAPWPPLGPGRWIQATAARTTPDAPTQLLKNFTKTQITRTGSKQEARSVS
jgi:hypothetical protein